MVKTLFLALMLATVPGYSTTDVLTLIQDLEITLDKKAGVSIRDVSTEKVFQVAVAVPRAGLYANTCGEEEQLTMLDDYLATINSVLKKGSNLSKREREILSLKQVAVFEAAAPRWRDFQAIKVDEARSALAEVGLAVTRRDSTLSWDIEFYSANSYRDHSAQIKNALTVYAKALEASTQRFRLEIIHDRDQLKSTFGFEEGTSKQAFDRDYPDIFSGSLYAERLQILKWVKQTNKAITPGDSKERIKTLLSQQASLEIKLP